MTLNCPHCRLAFDTDMELEIHNMSLGHHVQMHKMGHVWHTCPNCEFNCSSLSEYSQHASSDKHRQQVKMRRAFLDYVREDETDEEKRPSWRDQQREHGRERRDYRVQDDREREHRPWEYPRREFQRDFRRDWDNRRGGWQQWREQNHWNDRQAEFPRYPRGVLSGERRDQNEGERRETEERREKAETERRETVNTAGRPANEASNSNNAPSGSNSSAVVLPHPSSSRNGPEKNSHPVSASPANDHRKKRCRSKNQTPSAEKEKQPLPGGSSATSPKASKESPKVKAPCVVITKITPPPQKKNWEKMVSISAATQRQAERQAMARKRRYFLLDPNAASDETSGAPSSSVPLPSTIGATTPQSTSSFHPEPSSSPPTLLPFDFTPPPQRDPMQELNDTLRQVGSLCEYTLAPVKPKKAAPLVPSNPQTVVTVKEEVDLTNDDVQIIDKNQPSSDGGSTFRKRELANLKHSQEKIKGDMDTLYLEQYKLQADFEVVDKSMGCMIYSAEIDAGGGEPESSRLNDIGRKAIEYYKLKEKLAANHAQVYKLSLELKAIEDKQEILTALA